jgi:hypothetical protein
VKHINQRFIEKKNTLRDFNGSLPHPSIHCKKRLSFIPFPAGISLSKLSLAGNNLIIPGQGQFG